MFAVLIPVGPSELELKRLADLLDSLVAYEDCDDLHLILIDDSPSPRGLADFASIASTVVRTALWEGDKPPDPYSAMIAGTIDGLRVAAELNVDFALKLDTDALIIGPFSASLRELFKSPELGLVGSYDVTCMGSSRVPSFRAWARRLGRVGLPWTIMIRPPILWRKPQTRTQRQLASGIYARAKANSSYVPGGSCLGGAYAVSPRLLRHTELLDWRLWTRTQLGEDVIVGVIAGAAGFTMHSAVGYGEPFGLSHLGLPAPPHQLLKQRHSIIHSLKSHGGSDEKDLRELFREYRRHAVPIHSSGHD
jgi:hypothetical protein